MTILQYIWTFLDCLKCVCERLYHGLNPSSICLLVFFTRDRFLCQHWKHWHLCQFDFSWKCSTLFHPTMCIQRTMKIKAFFTILLSGRLSKSRMTKIKALLPYYRPAGCPRSCWRRLGRHSHWESQETRPGDRPAIFRYFENCNI